MFGAELALVGSKPRRKTKPSGNTIELVPWSTIEAGQLRAPQRGSFASEKGGRSSSVVSQPVP